MTMTSLSAALLRYRVLALVTGTALVILAFVAVPLHYLADRPGLSQIVAPIHGALFIIYCLCTLDVGVRRRWSFTRIVLVMLAGVVPVMTFVAERKVTREVQESLTVR